MILRVFLESSADVEEITAPFRFYPVLGVWRIRTWLCRCLEFGTRTRSGRSQEKRASLPKQRRLGSGNVSGKLIGVSDPGCAAPTSGSITMQAERGRWPAASGPVLLVRFPVQ